MENNILKQITAEAEQRGHSVRIRDIAFALMRVTFDDALSAYSVAFGVPKVDKEIENYESLESTKYLVRYFKKRAEKAEPNPTETVEAMVKKRIAQNTDEGSMTFEENRGGIERQIREIRELIEQAKNETPVDLKTLALLQKTEADLRSKLNDKFGGSEKSQDQYIVVPKKYNHICEWTRRECFLQTKEYAMEHWNLIENTNTK